MPKVSKKCVPYGLHCCQQAFLPKLHQYDTKRYHLANLLSSSSLRTVSQRQQKCCGKEQHQGPRKRNKKQKKKRRPRAWERGWKAAAKETISLQQKGGWEKLRPAGPHLARRGGAVSAESKAFINRANKYYSIGKQIYGMCLHRVHKLAFGAVFSLAPALQSGALPGIG